MLFYVLLVTTIMFLTGLGLPRALAQPEESCRLNQSRK